MSLQELRHANYVSSQLVAHSVVDVTIGLLTGHNDVAIKQTSVISQSISNFDF